MKVDFIKYKHFRSKFKLTSNRFKSKTYQIKFIFLKYKFKIVRFHIIRGI